MAEKRERWQKFSKHLKNFVKISIKLRVFSDRLFVSSDGRRGGGVHRGSDGEGVGNSGVGATARWGLGAIGGATVGGVVNL